MYSRILLALALAAPAPLALGQGTISPTPVPDDIACPPGTSVTMALPDFTDDDGNGSPGDTFTAWAEFSFDNNIMGAILDFTWRDQGFGNQKAGIKAEQKDHTGSVLAEEVINGIFARGISEPSPWKTESLTLAYAPGWTDVANFYRVGGGGGHKLWIKDATLTVNCAPCVECSPSAECPSGFDCDYTSGPSGGRKLRFGSLQTGCCRVV